MGNLLLTVRTGSDSAEILTKVIRDKVPPDKLIETQTIKI